jgi:alpha-glutamyl/putrescinyl thymine pyrophosphorylase clade 1
MWHTWAQKTRKSLCFGSFFKLFNKVSTWQLLQAELGDLTWSSFKIDDYDRVLSTAFSRGQRLYSAAYVVPPPTMGAARKHSNHLRLLQLMMKTGIAGKLVAATTMEQAFLALRAYPAIGDFLAFQYLIDLNYSPALTFDEMEYVVAGPGARDGLRKCFGPGARGIESELIRYMADTQDEHFARLGLRFGGLRGRRLQLIDCQNLFCEVDKYARLAHPDVAGISGRTRIKQKFTPTREPVTAWFPPRWGINDPSARRCTSGGRRAPLSVVV